MKTKILDEFQRKEETAAIFFNTEKVDEKLNRERTFEQLENVRIQEIMLDFI